MTTRHATAGEAKRSNRSRQKSWGFRRPHLMALLLPALGSMACALVSQHARGSAGSDCVFVVHNYTAQALDIRLERGLSGRSIGAVNPGELLSESIACAERRVGVLGVPIPAQVAAPVQFRAVYASAELVYGERVILPLYWP